MLRALAITGNSRSQWPTCRPWRPDIPISLAQLGRRSVRPTPAEITKLLHGEIVQILREPQMKKVLAGLGYEVVANTPTEFAERIRTETDMWRKLIQAANIKMS